MTMIGDYRFTELVEAIAAKTPTPGGGAVAGAVGAIAASLAGMVVAYSVGKKDLAAHQPALEAAARRLERARAVFLELADEDAAAYGLLSALQKLPENDPGRREQWAGAVAACVQVPMAVLAAAADLAGLCAELRPMTNKHLGSDLKIGVLLAGATARAAECNVRVNLPLIADEAERARVAREAGEMVARAEGHTRVFA